MVDVAAKVVRIHHQPKTYSEETHSKDTGRLTSVSRCHNRPGESLLIAPPSRRVTLDFRANPISGKS